MNIKTRLEKDLPIMNTDTIEDSRLEINYKVIDNIEDKIIDFLNAKQDYQEYIARKNIMEKRKFLTFLLLLTTNITLTGLTHLTVNDFIKLKDGKLINLFNEGYYNGRFYTNISSNNPSLLNSDLYKAFIDSKNGNDKLLSSIINNKPLAKHNLKKDFNDVFTDLLISENLKSRLT